MKSAIYIFIFLLGVTRETYAPFDDGGWSSTNNDDPQLSPPPLPPPVVVERIERRNGIIGKRSNSNFEDGIKKREEHVYLNEIQMPTAETFPPIIDRPVREDRQIREQLIPPMQNYEQVVEQSQYGGGPKGPLQGETHILTRRRPSSYQPLLPPPPPPSSRIPLVPITFPSPPSTQQLQNCKNLDPIFRNLLGMVNSFRREIIGKILGRRTAIMTSLCMNVKLMKAAKLQSDFQALVKLPTHAGPRMSSLGSVEERLKWAGFGDNNGGSSIGRSDGRRIGGQFSVEQVIYFWPHGPRTEMSKIAIIKRLGEAMKAWRQDERATAALTNPSYRFFGFGLTRTHWGQMYLTLLVAQSDSEACHVCPEDAPQLPSRFLTQPSDDEEEDMF